MTKFCACAFFPSLEKNQKHPPLAPLNKTSVFHQAHSILFFYGVIPKQIYLSLPLFACFYYAFNSTMEAKKGCELMY